MRPESVGGGLALAVVALVGCIVLTADQSQQSALLAAAAGGGARAAAAAAAAQQPLIGLSEALRRTGALNLTRQLARLARDQPEWTRAEIAGVDAKYRRFLAECAVALPQGGACVPAADVDELWHTHLLFSKQYESDCRRVFGHVLHHEPHDEVQQPPPPPPAAAAAAAAADADAAEAAEASCSAHQRLRDPFSRAAMRSLADKTPVKRGAAVLAAGDAGSRKHAAPRREPAAAAAAAGACDGTCNGNCGAAPTPTESSGGGKCEAGKCEAGKCQGGKCEAGKCSGGADCSGGMACGGTFSFGIKQTVLWSFWDIQSDGQFVISVFVIILIGLLREWLVVYRQHRLLTTRKKRRALPVSDRDPMLNGPEAADSQTMDFWDSVLYMLSVALAYVLMLIIMGFKYGTTFAVLGGLMLGHWIFTVKRLGFPKTLRLRVDEGDGCCEEPVEG